MDMQATIGSSLISSAVVPVVIISACGLIHLAFSNRLAMIFTRLRALHREYHTAYLRVVHFKEKGGDHKGEKEAEEFLAYLEHQINSVFLRARYLRDGILCLLIAVGSLILSCLMIGVSLIFSFLDPYVISLFVLGLLSFFCGLIFAFLEMRIALRPIQEESRFIRGLSKKLA